MAYIIDSDWIIQSLNGHQRSIQTLRDLAGAPLHVSMITVGEVYEVAFNSPSPRAYLDTLRAFLSPYTLVGVDEEIMIAFAEVRGNLRRRGEMIADLDTLIAATALARNLTLLTYNRRHFERVPDLRIYQAG
jgi:tRNA(fMet)-specific endonuclease VapC